jgi:predicted permease
MVNQLWSEFRYRVRALLRRTDVERELDDELRFHLEREAEKGVEAGIPAAAARRQARLAFGGLDRIKEDTRDSRGVTIVEHVTQDVRYALRGLAAQPLFAGVVIATLALGIGINAAMFGILDRVLFRPPAYLIDAGTVHRIYLQWTEVDGRRMTERLTEYPRYMDFARWSRSISEIAAFTYRPIAIGEGSATKEAIVGIVSASYFDFFDARPVIGRYFVRQEDVTPAGAAVAVIAYGYWQSQYGGRPNVLGSTIRIGTATYTIIGVAPSGFGGVSDHRAPVAFIPITTFGASVDSRYDRTYNWSMLELIVRRKPGVSFDAASADLSNAFRLSWNAERKRDLQRVATERPAAVAAPVQLARGPLAGPETKVMRWIGGVALVVLLIACANVANLLLARALRRNRELALRRAIGASRGRLAQQILTETIVLAILGTAAGLIAAQIGAASLRPLFVDADDHWSVIRDGRTIWFAFGLTLIIAVIAGLAPAMHSARDDLAGSLKAGMRDSAYRHSRLRGSLLVFQTALSVVLLIGAGLFVRSLQHVRAIRLGYDVEHIAFAHVPLRGVTLTGTETLLLSDRLLAEMRTVPGVANATFTVSIPLLGGERRSLYVPGVDSVRKLGRFQLQAGSPEYFATMGTRILRGRGLSPDDRATTPRVTVVSEAMAKALWKTDNPIGKCFGIDTDTLPCTTVVGVAENVRAYSISDGGEFMYYLPLAQYVAGIGVPEQPAFFIRFAGPPEDYIQSLRARVQPLLPGAAYMEVIPFRAIVDPAFRSWTTGTKMFLGFGMLALVIAAVGLYALVAFAVAQRTRELGVRIALGALPGDVFRLVVGEGLRVAVVGVLIGAAIAFFAAQRVAQLLFNESPTDPLVYGVAATTLLGVGVLASAVPALRAMRVDPNVTLRAE